MSKKQHRLSYSKADWDLINARQEHKWAVMASDVTVTKADGTVEIIPNAAKEVDIKKIPKKLYRQKRQQMFEGDI